MYIRGFIQISYCIFKLTSSFSQVWYMVTVCDDQQNENDYEAHDQCIKIISRQTNLDIEMLTEQFRLAKLMLVQLIKHLKIMTRILAMEMRTTGP